MFRKRKQPVFETPVLVVDALGVTQLIKTSDEAALVSLADRLDSNYLRFRQTMPQRIIITWGKKVSGTKEFNCFRLNDMFIVYAENVDEDVSLKYLVAAGLCFQALLLDGFIPRGGLGWGLVHARNDSLIGKGFLDAYGAAEKRDSATNDICAIKVSQDFLATVPRNAHCYRLMCFYRGEFFINPTFLTDPVFGDFSNDRIIELLIAAGINDRKLEATRAFLEGFEDYDSALKPDSDSQAFFSRRALDGVADGGMDEK